MKKLVFGALGVLTSAILFTGCGTDTSTDKSTSGGSLTTTITSSGSTISFLWARTNKAVYSGHTDLVAVNSNGVKKIAQTNSDSKMLIVCQKSGYDGSKGQAFSCASQNESFKHTFYIKDGEATEIRERGYYLKPDKGGEVTLTSISSDGSGSYTKQ